MICLDSNLLIYAHRAGVPEHRRARSAIERACGDARGCGVTVAAVCEFWSVVTHPAAIGGASTPTQAAAFLEALTRDGGVSFWLPGPGFGARLARLAVDLDVSGVRIFDLQIGLAALDNGAHEVWTRDGAFVRIPGLRVYDPFA